MICSKNSRGSASNIEPPKKANKVDSSEARGLLERLEASFSWHKAGSILGCVLGLMVPCPHDDDDDDDEELEMARGCLNYTDARVDYLHT